MSELLRLENVGFQCNGVEVLRNINLSVHPGDTVLITGHSGCGKSSVLEICAGILHPTRGHVWWGQQSLNAMNREASLMFHQNLGYVFQTHALISNLTVFDNLALPLRYHFQLTESEISNRIEMYLDLTGLQQMGSLLPERLSHSQKCKVALSRALITEPGLLIMDEPGAALDPHDRQLIVDLIDLNRQRRTLTLVLVSNILPLMRQLRARVFLLRGGELSFLDVAPTQTGDDISDVISHLA